MYIDNEPFFFFCLKNDESSDDEEPEEVRNSQRDAISVQPESRNVSETTGLNPSDKPPVYTAGTE